MKIDPLIIPGTSLREPLPLVPYCALCELPAERYVIEEKDDMAHSIDVDGMCCGRHMGMRVSAEQYLQVMSGKAKLWLIVRPGRFQKTGALRRVAAR